MNLIPIEAAFDFDHRNFELIRPTQAVAVAAERHRLAEVVVEHRTADTDSVVAMVELRLRTHLDFHSTATVVEPLGSAPMVADHLLGAVVAAHHCSHHCSCCCDHPTVVDWKVLACFDSGSAAMVVERR